MSQLRRRHPAKVGDLIQYHYEWGSRGFKRTSLTTRRIIEVIADGEFFVVEGFFTVAASQVTAHIPMHVERDDDAETYEFCGVGQ